MIDAAIPTPIYAPFSGCTFTPVVNMTLGKKACWEKGDDLHEVAITISNDPKYSTTIKNIFLSEANIRAEGINVRMSAYGGGVYAKRSSIAGIGVFARTGFKKLDLIEVCPSFSIPQSPERSAEAETLVTSAFWKKYSLQSDISGGNIYYLPGGHCPFYNHAPDAWPPTAGSRNVYWGSYYFEEIEQVITYMFAYKDINPDEELLLNYG